ncbi:hypothetical protein ARMGADRAFT_691085 [Armillaria gallica]|uniref:Uncharacterized protein n=1 Tax=Armillaria gallica TaxID=47427 RepID=A0A2H3E9G0_ARMGA|nr:hypothetical protein ARMGADRAFT_691085 [Armillaria gallica]
MMLTWAAEASSHPRQTLQPDFTIGSPRRSQPQVPAYYTRDKPIHIVPKPQSSITLFIVLIRSSKGGYDARWAEDSSDAISSMTECYSGHLGCGSRRAKGHNATSWYRCRSSRCHSSKRESRTEIRIDTHCSFVEEKCLSTLHGDHLEIQRSGLLQCEVHSPSRKHYPVRADK